MLPVPAVGNNTYAQTCHLQQQQQRRQGQHFTLPCNWRPHLRGAQVRKAGAQRARHMAEARVVGVAQPHARELDSLQRRRRKEQPKGRPGSFHRRSARQPVCTPQRSRHRPARCRPAPSCANLPDPHLQQVVGVGLAAQRHVELGAVVGRVAVAGGGGDHDNHGGTLRTQILKAKLVHGSQLRRSGCNRGQALGVGGWRPGARRWLGAWVGGWMNPTGSLRPAQSTPCSQAKCAATQPMRASPTGAAAPWP